MSWSVNPTLEELDGKHIQAATENGIYMEGRLNGAGEIGDGPKPIRVYVEQDGRLEFASGIDWVQNIWDERDWTTIAVDLAEVGDALIINNDLFVIQLVVDEPQHPNSFVVRDRINMRDYNVSKNMSHIALRRILPDKQGVYKTDNGTVVIRTKDHWELFDKKFNGSVELDDDELRAYLCNKGALNHAAVSKLEKEGQA